MAEKSLHSEVSRHKCLIYEGDPSEQLPVVVPLLLDGLGDNWRCLYLGSPEALRMVDAALADRGVDTERETRRGALVLSADRSHLAGGAFDPQAMVDGLRASIDEALRDGFDGLCATGDMRWELGDDRNFQRLVEYEACLDRLFRDKPLRGICQYHRDILPDAAIRDALLTHPGAYFGDLFSQDNLFYIPPELLLDRGDGVAAKRGEWMCQQIVRVLKAEHARDRALAEQQRLAVQLAEANRDLERRVAERTAELELANRHLEAFSYSVSHDLRAPLRAIAGFGEILAQEFGGELGAEGCELLDRVRRGASRMDELIESLLRLGRTANAPIERVPLDLTAIAEEVVRDLREADPARRVEVAIQRSLDSLGDPVLARVALTNLLGNAWKFTSRRAHARIEVGRSADESGAAVFFVRDNGAGFDMQHAERLFGVFRRLHGNDEFPGHGVGLATTERIIARHGGRIWAEARPDEGATFFFTLSRGGR